MRRNYKLSLMYDGTNYGGWQRQKNARTIQEELERALSVITRQEAAVIGASRTDAGVHAADYVANVFLDTEQDEFTLINGVNALLDEDIRLKRIVPCAEDFHARFDAKAKTYWYHIDNAQYRDVFFGRFMWHYRYPLDYEKMEACTKHFIGRHDFSAFMSKGGHAKTFVREIYDCRLTRSGDKMRLAVRGNGFLYHMVRIIAGTLVSAGRGDMNPDDIPAVIESRCRRCAGITAPPEGLVLQRIEY